MDRAQIRAMLRLTPEERLRRVEERAGRPKDLAALPVLRATLDELKRQS